MHERKGSLLKGAVTITLMGVNVAIWIVPLMLVALAKLFVPVTAWRRGASRVLTAIAECWIAGNNRIFRWMDSMPLTTISWGFSAGCAAGLASTKTRWPA